MVGAVAIPLAYLTVMAIAQVVGNLYLIAKTVEELVVDMVSVRVTALPAADETTQVDALAGTQQAQVRLEALGVRELRALAQQQGVSIRLNGKVMNKQQLIAVLM